jgi:hypothetical protein
MRRKETMNTKLIEGTISDRMAGLRELDPAELEDVEGGFLFFAGFAAGVVAGIAIGALLD